MQQIKEAYADPCHLVSVGWSNTTPSCPHSISSTGLILKTIEQLMIRHHNMSTIRNKQIVDSNPLSLYTHQFIKHAVWIDNSTSSHNTQTGWVKNPTRHQM